MSKCSKKCNEIIEKIASISGLDDDWVYGNLLGLENQVTAVVDSINKYADANELNGTIFKDCCKIHDLELIRDLYNAGYIEKEEE